jgi:hypothetical protein
MTPHDRAAAGLAQLKQAILEHLSAHPEGCRNVEVAQALGIRSDFEGDQKDYLSWSILGLLVGEEKVRYGTVGKQRRYFVHSTPAIASGEAGQ